MHSRGSAQANPVAWTERREEISRNRVIADDELCDIWVSLKNDTYGSIVKLLILSGARREEIGALRCSGVDFDKTLIKLPPERVKRVGTNYCVERAGARDLAGATKARMAGRQSVRSRIWSRRSRVFRLGWQQDRFDRESWWSERAVEKLDAA